MNSRDFDEFSEEEVEQENINVVTTAIYNRSSDSGVNLATDEVEVGSIKNTY